MKKICFITPQFKTGGGNRVFIELANELVKKEIEIEIIYPNNSKEKNTFEIDRNIKVLSIGRYSDFKILKLFNVIYTFLWLRKNRKNSKLIITDPIMSLFYFLLPLKNLYRFLQADDYRIFDDGMIIKNKIILKIYKFFIKISYQSNKIKYIFNSKFVYKTFLEDSKKKIKYDLVHPSINKNIFYNINKRSEKEINICIVARKHPSKGFITFIECWKKFTYKEKINKVYIISHDDLSHFDLSDKKFNMICPKSDMEIAQIMNMSHIFISTSWREGFGLPPLEAMACGCGLIISSSGGVEEYAKHDYNCLMYSPKDVEGLLKNLNILILNPGKRARLIENSKEIVKEFSWEKSTKQFLKIIYRNRRNYE